MTSNQILTVVILAVLLLLILPMYKSRTGKDFSEIIFGRRKDSDRVGGRIGLNRRSSPSDDTPEARKHREPHLNNGTAGDLKYFISSLVALAQRKKMKVVAPGTVVYKGKSANVTAFLVAKNRVICVHCLGFNGVITPSDDGSGNWMQHMNGEDIPFEGPVALRERCRPIVEGAFEKAGITVPLEFAAVFTTNGVKPDNSVLQYENVFVRNRFIDYVKKNADSLSQGDIDVEATALRIADVVGIEKMKQKEQAAKKSRK